MNAIMHDTDVTTWVADLEQTIAAVERHISAGKRIGVPLSHRRPGSAWAKAREIEPDFMAGMEHCQARGIAINPASARKLIHLILGQPYQLAPEPSDLSATIFEALGEASMCWSERPKGVFDSTRAKQIGERLLQRIQSVTYPAELNDELRAILGRPNFTCAGIAQRLRDGGATIPNKAELEQAHVIDWLLRLYLKHGAEWASEGEKLLKAIKP